MIEAFGFWLQGQLANAARKRLGGRLFGSEQDRALLNAGVAAIGRTARELRPGGSDKEVEHLAAVVDQVFQARLPTAPLEEMPTVLQALQAGVTAQLAVLGDASATGTGWSAAAALGLPVEGITTTLIRNVVQEILSCGAGGGPLGPLADQLNHDLTHLQGEHTAGLLARIVEELVRPTQPRPLAAQPIPRELPRPVADFTGRSDELAMLRDLLTVSSQPGTQPVTVGRPVVISAIDGMGGIGKSALAIHLAHELVEAGTFPDGQLYVNLQGAGPGPAPLDPLDALGRMLRALGFEPAQIPTDTEEAAARFRSLAAARRLLVLLDNAASAEQVRPLLPASPTCGVLITSRQVLALEGTRPLHLDVLPRDQALELLARIAGRQRITAEPDAAAEVVRLCGSLPLAIRIAAARLAARPVWETRGLATLLADATRRLEELQFGELAVRASFDVSLHALEQSPDPLDHAAVAAFGLLSVPDGPDLGLAAAARLLDQSERSARRLLERLVDAQLLETPRQDRYQFHDLVRLYSRQHALNRHPGPERLAALTRLLTFYAATAWDTLAWLRPSDLPAATTDRRVTDDSRFPDATAALSWLEGERANLLGAISQAAALSDPTEAELACQLTHALFGFFSTRGHWRDGAQANQTALKLARHTRNQAALAHVLYDLAIFFMRLGRYTEAIACQQESLTIRRGLGDRGGEASSLSSLGIVYGLLGRFAEATTYQQDSLTIYRELGDRRGEASSLNYLGIVVRLLGRYTEAIAYQQDSLSIYRELGDRRGEAFSLNNLGIAYRRLGRHADAIAYHLESLAIRRDIDDRPGVADSLNDLGAVYQQLGRHAEAIAYHQDSLTIYREAGDRSGEANSLHNLGGVHRLLGRHAEAIAHQQESLAIYRELGDRRGEAHSLNKLGAVHRLLGRHTEAIAHQQESLIIYRQLGERHGEAETLRDLGDALRTAGRDREASAVWQEALTICEAMEVPEAEDIRQRLVVLRSEGAELPGTDRH